MKTFYANLVYFFSNDKTSWGRTELVAKIKEIYIEAMEDEMTAKTQGDLDA